MARKKPRLITTSDPESRGGRRVEINGMRRVSDRFEIMSLKFPSRKFSQEDGGLLLSHPKILWAQGHLAQPAAWYRLSKSPCTHAKASSKILFVKLFYAVLFYFIICWCMPLPSSLFVKYKSLTLIEVKLQQHIQPHWMCLSVLSFADSWSILRLRPDSPMVWVAPMSQSVAI